MADELNTQPKAFTAAPTQLDLPSLETDILHQWKSNDVEGRSLRAGAPGAAAAFLRTTFFFAAPAGFRTSFFRIFFLAAI